MKGSANVLRAGVLIAWLICGGGNLQGQSPGDPADEVQFQTLADRYWRILQNRPRRDTAFDLWYRHYLDAGKLDNLLAQVQQHAEAKTSDARAQLLLGLVHERRGEDAEALEAYTAAERLAPADYYPPLVRGALLIRKGQPKQAAEALSKAISLKPPRAELLEVSQRLARLYLQMNRTDEALKTLSELMTQFPGDRRVLEELAGLLAEEGEYEAAIERYRQVAELAKDDPYQSLQALIEIAQLTIKKGQRLQGIELLEQALDETLPESWLDRDLRRRIEHVFLQNEDTAGHIAWCEGRLKRKPQDLQTMLQLARALRHEGRTADALERLRQCILLAPTQRNIREAYIEALAGSGNAAEALAECQKLAEQHPQDIDLLRRLGELHLAAAVDFERVAAEQQAAKAWKRIAAIRPQDANLAVQTAEACRRATAREAIGQRATEPNDAEAKPSSLLTTAEAYYREAVRRAPDQPQYLEYLGEFLHAQGRGKEAVAVWAKIGTTPEPSVESWRRLAEVYSSFGYVAEAVEASSKAVESNPRDFALRELHLRLLIEKPDYDAAKVEADQLLHLAVDDTQRQRAIQQRMQLIVASKRVEDEIARLRRLSADDEAKIEDRWLLGLLLAERPQFPEAADMLRRAVEQAPANIPLAVDYATVLEESGRHADAIEQFRRLAALDPKHCFTYTQPIVQLEIARGRLREALAVADTLVRLSPSSLEAYRLRAEVHFRSEHIKEALNDLRHIVRLAPTDVGLRRELAASLATHGEPIEALEQYWRAFELSDHLDMRLDLIDAMITTAQKSRRTVDVLERLHRLRLRQDDPKPMTLCLAQALVRLQHWDAARQELVELLQSHGEDVNVLRQLVKVAEGQKSWAAALEYQQRIVALDPSRAGLQRLADLYSINGDAPAASRVLAQLLQSSDESAAINLIDRQLSIGRVADALELCKLYLSRDPASWKVLLRAGCTQLALPDKERATGWFAQILNLPEEPVSTRSAPSPPASLVPPVATVIVVPRMIRSTGANSANAGVVISPPPFAAEFPQAQAFRAVRAAQKLVLALTTKERAAAGSQPRMVVRSSFPMPLSGDLEWARIVATTGLMTIIPTPDLLQGGLDQQNFWVLPGLRRLILVRSVMSPPGDALTEAWCRKLEQLEPDDPLPHLVRLSPASPPTMQRGLRVPLDRSQAVAGLTRSYQWLCGKHPEAQRNLAYYYITRLAALGEYEKAAEALSEELQQSQRVASWSKLLGLVHDGNNALLRTFIARVGQWPPDPRDARQELLCRAFLLELAVTRLAASTPEDARNVVAVLDMCLALDLSRDPPPAQAIPGLVATVPLLQQRSIAVQIAALQEQLRINEALLRKPAALSDARVRQIHRDIIAASLQLQQLTADRTSTFPTDNAHLDANRLNLLQSVYPWLERAGRGTLLVELVAQRQAEADKILRTRYGYAEFCLLWWSRREKDAAARLEKLCENNPEDNSLHLALAQAWFQQRDMRRSLEALERIQNATPYVVQETTRLRNEIQRRWFDLISMREMKGHVHFVRAVAFSPDGKWLVSASSDRTLVVWSVPQGIFEKRLVGHTEAVLAVAWSPRGDTIASVGSDGIRLWNAANGKLVDTLTGHAGAVRAVAFSPDGSMLATAGDDRVVRLWNLRIGGELAVLEGHTNAVQGLAFSPDGKLLASASADRTTRLWDVAQRKLADTLTGHSYGVACVAFAPDGKTLATGGEDSHAMLWRLPAGKVFATLQEHANDVLALSFSPDGTMLATGSADTTVKVWKLKGDTFAPATLKDHQHMVAGLAWSPDGTLLATGSYDETVRLWALQIPPSSDRDP